jgi:hypothetical protein
MAGAPRGARPAGRSCDYAPRLEWGAATLGSGGRRSGYMVKIIFRNHKYNNYIIHTSMHNVFFHYFISLIPYQHTWPFASSACRLSSSFDQTTSAMACSVALARHHHIGSTPHPVPPFDPRLGIAPRLSDTHRGAGSIWGRDGRLPSHRRWGRSSMQGWWIQAGAGMAGLSPAGSSPTGSRGGACSATPPSATDRRASFMRRDPSSSSSSGALSFSSAPPVPAAGVHLHAPLPLAGQR